MTSHETRYSTRNKSAASDQNDLKKLKSKYSAKLPTLKVLFSDWSDDDLLFVLEEANGDLDITIDRISEGHANQWGEVKTKKSKKEAQKAKAATATVSTNQQQSTITPYRDTKPTSSRSYNSPRAGKAPFTQRTRTPKTASWDTQPKATTTTTSQEVSSGSWASIAKQHSDTFGNDDGWNTSNDNVPASTTDEWGTTTNSAPANDTITTNDITDDDQPKTWASLLKSKTKTEPEAEENETNNNDWEAPSSNVNTDAWDSNVNTTTTSGWDAPNEPAVDEWSTPVHETTVAEPEPVKEQEEEKEATPVISNSLLNQEEPVVLPNETTSISNLDVKFGSLNVNEDNNTVEETIKETTIVAEPPVEEPVVAAAAPVQQTISTAPPTSATTAPVTNDAFNQSYLKQQQEPAYSQQPAVPQQQQVQPPQQQQPVQPQQQQQIPQQPLQQQQIPQQGVPQQQAGVPQQQQQQLGMDHLTSAYSSYLPNQPPTGVSGFGMNPMGNLPDYGIYGTEAQRAAAMGYYDPTAFSHSPSVTSASVYGRDKYTQDQTQSIPQQQMYPPYYQYYYMPNQFNAYQQSAYGQPFMNKYPYQGKPTNTAAGATASPYGSVSSPYQSQLYNNHQYDDLNIDYQKSMYPQYQGFLGNLNGQPQQQGQQPPQQQQQPQQAQTPSKETTGTPASSAPQVQQQQQQPAPQQQLPQQYANYFGQPQQMFSYGQYPQYQQQQRQQQQQQYWNQ